MWTLPARIYNLSYLCREPINIIPEKKLDKKQIYFKQYFKQQFRTLLTFHTKTNFHVFHVLLSLLFQVHLKST